MIVPKSRIELKAAIGAAWSRYLLALKRLLVERANRLGLPLESPERDLGGLAAAHAKIGPLAGDAYQTFTADQGALSAAWGKYVDAPAMRRQAHEDYDRALENAKARVVAAETWVNEYQRSVDEILSGKFAQYGVTEPDPKTLEILSKYKLDLESAESDLVLVTAQARKKLTEALVELDSIRPEGPESAPSEPISNEDIADQLVPPLERTTALKLVEVLRDYGDQPRLVRELHG